MNTVTMEDLQGLRTQIDELTAKTGMLSEALAGVNKGKTHLKIAGKEKPSEYIQDHRDEWVSLGEHYREQREAMGLSKAAIARLVGCSPSSISAFELGEPMRIASLLEHSYDLIIGLSRHHIPLDNIWSSALDPWEYEAARQ